MILQASHIAKYFGRKRVLEDISFEVMSGTLSAIVGENGAGKSTLLKIIVGHWRATRGLITVQGKVGYCPQQPLLFPQLTVKENFQYFAAAYDIPLEDLSMRIDPLLDQFSFGKFQQDRVGRLSGGTKQKLNLCLSLMHDPDLLILDEPYNGFDWETYLRFWDYVDTLKDHGCAILIVTHFINETERFDHVYELREGVFQ